MYNFIMSSQDDRKVLWVWEEQGKVGKTFLAKWLMVWRQAFYIQNGKNADIAHAFAHQTHVVLDLTRSQEGMLNYGMIESFKNGIFFSPKYNSITKRFKPVKLVVFANWAPDRSKLSADRWDIHHIAVPKPQPAPPAHPSSDTEVEESEDEVDPATTFCNGVPDPLDVPTAAAAALTDPKPTKPIDIPEVGPTHQEFVGMAFPNGYYEME
jgi:hypothetical protein